VNSELLLRAVVLASAASLAACAGMGKNENVDYRAVVATRTGPGPTVRRPEKKSGAVARLHRCSAGDEGARHGSGRRLFDELLAARSVPRTVYAQDAQRFRREPGSASTSVRNACDAERRARAARL